MAMMPPGMDPSQGQPQPQPQGQPQGNPLAALASKGGGGGGGMGGGSLLQMILTFLAGAGLKDVFETVNKFSKGLGGRGSLGGDQTRPHKGLSVQGSAQPGVQQAPSAQGGTPPGGQPGQGSGIPPELLQRLKMMLAQGGQGGQ